MIRSLTTRVLYRSRRASPWQALPPRDACSQTDGHVRGTRQLTTKHDIGVVIDGDGSDQVAIQGTIPSNGTGIKIGQYAELHRTFSQRDVNNFGALVGDFNPVHFPANEKQPIVHGMLLSSVFSTIFGTLIPGCIYRSQSLKFYAPVDVGEWIVGRVVVTKLREVNRNGSGVLCTCDTTVRKTVSPEGADGKTGATSKGEKDNLDQDVLCISGEAQVWLPRAETDER